MNQSRDIDLGTCSNDFLVIAVVRLRLSQRCPQNILCSAYQSTLESMWGVSGKRFKLEVGKKRRVIVRPDLTRS